MQALRDEHFVRRFGLVAYTDEVRQALIEMTTAYSFARQPVLNKYDPYWGRRVLRQWSRSLEPESSMDGAFGVMSNKFQSSGLKGLEVGAGAG
jgi:hypothetical protein